MAIEQILSLCATCDNCKKLFDDGEFQIFPDEVRLKEKLDESEWTNENGDLLCFDCITNYENEDQIQDLKVKPYKTKTDD